MILEIAALVLSFLFGAVVGHLTTIGNKEKKDGLKCPTSEDIEAYDRVVEWAYAQGKAEDLIASKELSGKIEECNLNQLRWNGKIYSVVFQGTTMPAAVFTCRHCAEQWARYRIGGIQIISSDAKLFGDFFDKCPDGEIIHDTYDGTAFNALNEAKSKS